MSISAEDRRHLLERLEQVTDERAARTMSEFFDEHDDEDPSIMARFDQQDAALRDHSARFDQIDRRFETQELQLDHRFDRLALELTGVFRTEIAAAITSQTRTVIFGMLGSAAALFAMAIAIGQVL
jgi:hypothetical protein